MDLSLKQAFHILYEQVSSPLLHYTIYMRCYSSILLQIRARIHAHAMYVKSDADFYLVFTIYIVT